MAQYQIPEQFLSGFKQLLSLPQEQIDKIGNTLREMPVGTGPKTMTAMLAKQVAAPNISFIGQAVFSMGNLLAANDVSTSEIAEGLAEAYYEQDEGENEDTKSILSEKIKQILNAGQNIKTTFKAFNLLSANERIYRQGHLISDIRLVFNDDLDNAKRHALILHQLKLEHQVAYASQEFFITLDTKDLYKLKEQIDRALEKEKEIKASYGNDVKFIDITE